MTLNRRQTLALLAAATALPARAQSFEQARIPQTGRAAIALDLILTDGEDFNEGQIIRHLASFV